MYGSVEQAFVGRDEPKKGCEGGYLGPRISRNISVVSVMRCKWQIENSTCRIVQKILYSPNRTNWSSKTSIFSDKS